MIPRALQLANGAGWALNRIGWQVDRLATAIRDAATWITDTTYHELDRIYEAEHPDCEGRHHEDAAEASSSCEAS